MATKCCSGGNECNHVVTIGYLKNLVNVSGEGNIVSVNNSDNTYCPTYDELTGGTLIQNHSDGTTPNSDVDGIVISGNYANNQLVNQEDLSLIYTRFKLLTISATKTSGLDPCGDSSTLSYVHKYTRYTRSMTSDCETVDDPFDAVTLTSTDINDTANNELSWSIAATAYGSISFPAYTIGKNGDGTSVTNARYDDITASVTFRGTSHMSSTLRITQSGLGGSWVFDHNENTFNYTSLVCTPTTFACEGGNYSVVGSYTRTDWTIYHWKNSCNEEYSGVISSSTPTQTSLTENVAQGTAPVIDCGTLTQDYTHTENFAWHGLSATWTQTCEPCSDCASLTLAPTSMAWDYNKFGSSVQSSATYSFYAASVTIVSMTCTGTNASDFTVTHDSGNKKITVYPNSQNGTITARTATVVLTYNTSSANDCKKMIALTQGVESCDCNSVTISPTSYTWEWDSTTQRTITISSAICITSIDIAGSDLPYFNATIDAGKVTVSPKGQNITTSDYSGTLNINYSFGNPVSSCTKTVTLIQGCQGCGCTALTMDETSMSWTSDSTASSERTYTLVDASCIHDMRAYTGGTDGNRFSVSLDQTNRKVTVAPIGTNTTVNSYNGTITLEYEVNGIAEPCRKVFNVIQNGVTCDCNSVTISPTSYTWTWDSTTQQDVTITSAACITSIDTGSSLTHFNATLGSGKVTVSPKGQNTTTSDYSGTLNINYSFGNPVSSCTKTVYLTQENQGCGCTALTMDETSMSWGNTETTSSARTYTLEDAACVSSISVATGGTDGNKFSVSLDKTNRKVTVAPIGNNMTLNTYNGTITLRYSVNGVANPCEISFNVSQAAMSCSCNDLTMDNSPMSWGNTETTSSARTYTIVNASCIGNITAYTGGTDGNKFTASVNTSTKKVTVAPIGTNTTLNAYNGTVTLTYAVNGIGNCYITFDVTQVGITCNCSSVTVSPTSYSWSYNDTTPKDVTIASANCITSITTGGSLSHFTASLGSNKVTVRPNGNNTSTGDYAETLNITYSFGSPVSSCTKSVTLTQYSQGCTCGALTMSNSPMSWGSTETTASARTYTIVDASCVGTVTVSTGGTNGNKFTASLSGNRLTVAPIGTNTTSSAYNGTVTLTYAVNGIGNCYITFDVTQAGTTCNCNSFSMITGDLTLECTATTGTRAFTPGTCNTVTSVTSSNNWFTAAVNGNNIVITASGVNDSGLAKSATITVNYTANGSTCTAKTFTVIQAGCNPCDNISGLPDSINFTAS